MSRPLRSALITRASPLLRAGPPADSASVPRAPRFLSPGALPLAARPRRRDTTTAADVNIGTRLPTFRAKAAGQARAAFMPGTAWPVNGISARLIPGSS